MVRFCRSRVPFKFGLRAVAAILGGLLLLGGSPGALAQETREEALALLESKGGEVSSWTADYLMLMNAQGSAVTSEGRMEVQGAQLRNEMTIDMMGQSVPVVAITGADGVTWTETDLFGQKTVMKMDAAKLADAAGGLNPAAGQASVDPRQLVEFLRETPEAVYLGPDDLDGEAVLAFEMPLDDEMRATLDTGGQMAQLGVKPEKLQLMVAKRDGFPRLWQLLDAQGATVMSVVYRNLKLNPDIPASRFQYTPAENQPVMDLTALAGELLGNLENSESLSSNPEIQELLGQLKGSTEEKEAKPDKEEEPKYNRKFRPGDAAPAFTASTLKGGTIDLAKYKGQVVLLDFWASWSAPYEEALPFVSAAREAYEAEGLKIIGVSLDDDRAAAEGFLAKHPEMTWPQVFDGKGWSNAVAEQYGIEAIPHRILIGKDGVILKTGLRGEALARALDQVFAQ